MLLLFPLTQHEFQQWLEVPILPPASPFSQVKTFGEACLMVRKPALELLHYLKNTNFAYPAVRYVLCILSCLPGTLLASISPLMTAQKKCKCTLAEDLCLVVFSLTASILDGERGTGKTLSLCHAIHFCAKHGWLILHIPDGKNFPSSVCQASSPVTKAAL